MFQGGKLAIRALILLAGTLWLSVPLDAAEQVGCLACHPQHYAELGGCVDCHRGEPGTRRMDIAHHRFIPARFADFTLPDSPVVREGQQLVKATACRRCHILGGKGGRMAANLDQSFHDRSATELYTAIKAPALFMPDFRFSEQQLDMLVNAIQAEGRESVPPQEETPLKIHFEDSGDRQDSVFEKHCGGCHRVMTLGMGSLGRGRIGPDLSGLFSEFYPPSYPDAQEKTWTSKGLETWLKNPRKLKSNALMPPSKLKVEEIRELIKILTDKPSQSSSSPSSPQVSKPHV